MSRVATMSTDTTEEVIPRATLREWIGLAVLVLPTMLVSIDVSVMLLALPHIGASLGADSTAQLWIMDIYGFMLAGFMITMGTLGDRIGRRKLLMIGGGAFGLASILAAFSPTAELLIASRALLGIAGATLSPSMLALISNMFRDDRQRAFAISTWITCFLGGMVLGPVVGGALLERFWWGSVFLVGAPFMLLMLVTAPVLLPEYRAPHVGRLDLFSVALSLCAILPAIYGLKEFAKHGLQPIPSLAIVAGVAIGFAFVARQRRLESPLLDLSLFGHRAFTAALVSMSGIAFIGANMLFITQYLQLVEGLSPLQAGMWMLPAVTLMMVGLQLSPLIARRVRPAHLIAAGLLVAVGGFVALAMADAAGGHAAVVLGYVLFNIGGAPLVTLGTGLIVGAAPPERAGSAAAMSQMSGELGFALGIAALGSLGTATYRAGIGQLLPAGLPAEAATAAHESLAGATAAAADLSGPLGIELLTAAREAFVGGMHAVAIVSAFIVLGVALLALTVLRHVRPIGEAQTHQPDEAAGMPATSPVPAPA